eukprot:355924-Chlamydomonas_euryale.AAC.7
MAIVYVAKGVLRSYLGMLGNGAADHVGYILADQNDGDVVTNDELFESGVNLLHRRFCIPNRSEATSWCTDGVNHATGCYMHGNNPINREVGSQRVQSFSSSLNCPGSLCPPSSQAACVLASRQGIPKKPQGWGAVGLLPDVDVADAGKQKASDGVLRRAGRTPAACGMQLSGWTGGAENRPFDESGPWGCAAAWRRAEGAHTRVRPRRVRRGVCARRAGRCRRRGGRRSSGVHQALKGRPHLVRDEPDQRTLQARGRALLSHCVDARRDLRARPDCLSAGS